MHSESCGDREIAGDRLSDMGVLSRQESKHMLSNQSSFISNSKNTGSYEGRIESELYEPNKHKT